MRRRGSVLVTILIVGGLVLAIAGERRPIADASEGSAPPPDPFEALRQQMVQQAVVGWGIESPTVIAAMGAVPRHLFVPDEYLNQAYENHPLPIGLGQTISQPYIVALMTQELGVSPGDRVLEIGTGSGYQAAVLATGGTEAYSIEIIGSLAEEAQKRLEALGYRQARVRHADGHWGWPEAAPFDGIIVTAAPDHVPQPLLDQLKVGGTLIIPVGTPGGYQELWRIVRQGGKDYRSTSLGGPAVRAADKRRLAVSLQPPAISRQQQARSPGSLARAHEFRAQMLPPTIVDAGALRVGGRQAAGDGSFEQRRREASNAPPYTAAPISSVTVAP